MRANHATKPQEPAPRGVGARRAIGRWLPRVLAAGGALLLQLGGFGAQDASADPLPDQTRPAVLRTLASGPAPGRLVQTGRPAYDGPSAERSADPGRPAAEEADRPSPGLVGELTGAVPDAGIDGTTDAVGSVFQDRIRAGGLPCPGNGPPSPTPSRSPPAWSTPSPPRAAPPRPAPPGRAGPPNSPPPHGPAPPEATRPHRPPPPARPGRPTRPRSRRPPPRTGGARPGPPPAVTGRAPPPPRRSGPAHPPSRPKPSYSPTPPR